MIKGVIFQLAHTMLNRFPKIANFLIGLLKVVGIGKIVSSKLAKTGFWKQTPWFPEKDHPNLIPSSKTVAEVVNWLKSH